MFAVRLCVRVHVLFCVAVYFIEQKSASLTPTLAPCRSLPARIFRTLDAPLCATCSIATRLQPHVRAHVFRGARLDRRVCARLCVLSLRFVLLVQMSIAWRCCWGLPRERELTVRWLARLSHPTSTPISSGGCRELMQQLELELMFPCRHVFAFGAMYCAQVLCQARSRLSHLVAWLRNANPYRAFCTHQWWPRSWKYRKLA